MGNAHHKKMLCDPIHRSTHILHYSFIHSFRWHIGSLGPHHWFANHQGMMSLKTHIGCIIVVG